MNGPTVVQRSGRCRPRRRTSHHRRRAPLSLANCRPGGKDYLVDKLAWNAHLQPAELGKTLALSTLTVFLAKMPQFQEQEAREEAVVERMLQEGKTEKEIDGTS